jgi:hypothetical protein
MCWPGEPPDTPIIPPDSVRLLKVMYWEELKFVLTMTLDWVPPLAVSDCIVTIEDLVVWLNVNVKAERRAARCAGECCSECGWCHFAVSALGTGYSRNG